MKNLFLVQHIKKQKGFTLIELLVVIGILAVLLAITLIAVNPQRQFQLANNTKRSSDVNAILNAVNQFMTENGGAAPGGITGTATEIGNGTGQIDICADLVPQYMAALPVDPGVNNGQAITNCATAGQSTGYEISISAANNRVTVTAPDAELGATISVTR